MPASNRSIRRKKEKQAKKLAKKMTAHLEKAASKMPKQCDECEKAFDKEDVKSFSHWRIAVYDDGPVHLVCPDCVPDDVKNKSNKVT